MIPLWALVASGPMLKQVPSRMLPLADRRIIFTGHRSSPAPRLAARLAEKGARPLFMPTIGYEPCAEAAFAPLDEALLRLPDYDVVCLPLADAVRALHDRTAALMGFDSKMAAQMLAGVRLAAIGSNAYLVKDLLGVSASIVPPEPSLSGLAAALEGLNIARSGARVLCLLPVYVGMAEPAAITRFVAQIEATGAILTRVAVCIASPTTFASAAVELGLLRAGSIDAVVLTSGSEVEGLWQLLRADKAACDRRAREAAGEPAPAPRPDAAQGAAVGVDWSALLPSSGLTIAACGADAMLCAEVWGLEPAVVSSLGLLEEIIEGLESCALNQQLLSSNGLIL